MKILTLLNRLQLVIYCSLNIAILLSISIILNTNFQISALAENDTSKDNALKMTMLLSDMNGTEVSRIPLNVSENGNTTATMGPTISIIIKNMENDTLIANFHVQTGCEMGGPLGGCVLK